MKNLKPLLIIVLFLFISCSSDDDPPETNIRVTNFINEVVDIMEVNSINRNTISWDDFRTQVLARAENAQNVTATDDALRLALQLLGDNHSFIRKQNGTFISGSSIVCRPSDLSPVATPDNVGYIKINSFSGNDQSESLAFAENIQNEIRVQDSENISGWIVDLRNNPGGNMWPMLAGVGPVLGEGIAGYFIGPDNESTAWSYANGAAILGQNTIANVTSAYTLLNSDSKVAVLLNRAVISSGEAIAISFIGRSNTETFGEATCGLSTSNSGFSLSDGSTLLLTTAFMADRNQNVYGESILPDNAVSDGELIQAAIDYINN